MGKDNRKLRLPLLHVFLDYNFDVQAAIEAPRWLYGRTWGAASNSLKMEGRIAKDTIDQLQKRGHQIEILEEFTDVMGHAGVIKIDPSTNVKYGGADPRGDGVAIGY